LHILTYIRPCFFTYSNNPPRLFFPTMSPTTKSTFAATNDNITKARLGYALVRLAGNNFSFGKFNPRPLNPKQVTRLMVAFQTDGVRNRSTETVLPLVLPNASCVELSSLIKEVDGDLSLLELTEEGKKLEKLEMMSGQHRLKAAMARHTKLLEEKKTVANALKRVTDPTELQKLEERFRELDGLIHEVTYWGVAVFNGSKSIFY
jgi:hypothetical protein